MIEFKLPKNEELDNLHEAYDRNAWLDQNIEKQTDRVSSEQLPSLGQIYSYVMQPSKVDPIIGKKIKTDPLLMGIYRDILTKTAKYVMQEAMAASSQEFQVRTTKDLKLSIEESKAEKEQLYVIIQQLDKRKYAPKTMHINLNTDLPPLLQELPEPIEGIIQFIVPRNSELIELLKNPNAEIKFT